MDGGLGTLVDLGLAKLANFWRGGGFGDQPPVGFDHLRGGENGEGVVAGFGKALTGFGGAGMILGGDLFGGGGLRFTTIGGCSFPSTMTGDDPQQRY